jgi:2-keto-3-deoxy-L-rhamnonate aldolase RhmA
MRQPKGDDSMSTATATTDNVREEQTIAQARAAALVGVQYDAIEAIAALDRMIEVIQPSGIDGSHDACVRLNKIRRAIGRTVRRLDGPITEFVRRHELACAR